MPKEHKLTFIWLFFFKFSSPLLFTYDLRLKFVGFEGKGGEVEEIRGVEYLRISEGSGEVKLCAVMLDRLQSKSVDHRWSVESVKGVATRDYRISGGLTGQLSSFSPQHCLSVDILGNNLTTGTRVVSLRLDATRVSPQNQPLSLLAVINIRDVDHVVLSFLNSSLKIHKKDSRMTVCIGIVSGELGNDYDVKPVRVQYVLRGPSILKGKNDFYLTSRNSVSCVALFLHSPPRVFPRPITMALKTRRGAGLQIKYNTRSTVIQVIGDNHDHLAWSYVCSDENCVEKTDARGHQNSPTVSEDDGSVKMCVTFQHQSMEEFVEFYIVVEAKLGISSRDFTATHLKGRLDAHSPKHCLNLLVHHNGVVTGTRMAEATLHTSLTSDGVPGKSSAQVYIRDVDRLLVDFSTAGDSILASSEDHQVSVCIETKLGRIGEDSDIKPIKFKHILTNETSSHLVGNGKFQLTHLQNTSCVAFKIQFKMYQFHPVLGKLTLQLEEGQLKVDLARESILIRQYRCRQKGGYGFHQNRIIVQLFSLVVCTGWTYY